MKRYYIRQHDYDSLFANVKLLAFTLRYQELYDYLSDSKVNQHGQIVCSNNYWQMNLEIMRCQDDRRIDFFIARERAITKQARKVGLVCRHNAVSAMRFPR